MKIHIEIRSGKLGASTRTTVDGAPKNEAERIIYTCLEAGINAGLDRANRELEARHKEQQLLGAVADTVAQVKSDQEPKKP